MIERMVIPVKCDECGEVFNIAVGVSIFTPVEIWDDGRRYCNRCLARIIQVKKEGGK